VTRWRTNCSADSQIRDADARRPGSAAFSSPQTEWESTPLGGADLDDVAAPDPTGETLDEARE